MNYKTISNYFIVFVVNISTVFISEAQHDQNSILWEISGNGLEKSSYLFGIINFLPKNEFSVSKNVRRAMEESKVFISKTPINRPSRNKFSKAVRIPNDGWINDYLTDDELNQLRLLMLKDLDVTEHDYHFFYSRLQPVILVTATTLLYLDLDDNVVFSEDLLAKTAKKSKLKFKSLGTVEDEIAAFEQFPMQDQVEALKYTINNFNEHIEDYNQLVRYYSNEQDLDKIHEEILKATNRSEKFQEVYYYSRNKLWTGKIHDLISMDPAFIVIGAAHLSGERGLIQLLRAKGYTMDPISAFD